MVVVSREDIGWLAACTAMAVAVARDQVIIVCGRLARRVREEAKKLGLSVDEYLVELLSQGLDPEVARQGGCRGGARED